MATLCTSFKKQRKSLSGLLQRLQSRETSRGRPGTACLQSRKLYQNVFPNHTVYNVEVPNCFIKKFTSDGEFLLCFTRNLQGIQLYRFGRFHAVRGADVSQREKKFETYFESVYEKSLTSGNEVLCRDFCLTTSCGNFFILASSCQSKRPSYPSSNTNAHATTSQSNTSRQDATSSSAFADDSCTQNLSLSSREDYTFYLVGVHDGQVYAKRSFKDDVIQLNHHAGVYLYNDLFVVLSLETQTVHMFQIKGSSWSDVRAVGRQCAEDDDLELGTQQERERQFESHLAATQQYIPPCLEAQYTCPPTPVSPSSTCPVTCQQYLRQSVDQLTLEKNKPATEQVASATEQERQLPGSSGPIMGIKHRLLAYLFRKAQESPDPVLGTRRFFQQFAQYSSLIMWKMQLLDEAHLLIKFGSIDGVLIRSQADTTNLTAFFVVYNFQTTEVVSVYDNTNQGFAHTFEQFCEHFRACSSPSDLMKYRSTCSNNDFVREHLIKQKLAVAAAKNGGETQAVKRILSALPFSPQCWSESPYFDKSLFSYDDKVISSTERPKPCVDYPIKFYSRTDGHLQFKINPGLPEKSGDRTKRFASYVFHPFYPFIISIQHTLFQPAVVNFHIRKEESE